MAGNNVPTNRRNNHIDASHARQPLAAGDMLVRYEVNAVLSLFSVSLSLSPSLSHSCSSSFVSSRFSLSLSLSFPLLFLVDPVTDIILISSYQQLLPNHKCIRFHIILYGNIKRNLPRICGLYQ